MKKTKLILILASTLLAVTALALLLTFVILPAMEEDSNSTPAKTTSVQTPTTSEPPTTAPVTMSEAEKLAATARLEELREEFGMLHQFLYLERQIAGATPPRTSWLTLEQVKEIIAKHDDHQLILDEITQIQPYADVVHGSGNTTLQFWLDENGNSYIVYGRGVFKYVVRNGDESIIEQLFPQNDPA